MNRFRHFAIVFPVFSLALLFAPERLPAQEPSSDAPLVLNNVTVVDVRTGTLRPDQTVIIEGNHIAFAGPNKSDEYSRHAHVVNGRNLFVIPGLWDMHVHLVLSTGFPAHKKFRCRSSWPTASPACATWAANSASCRDGATRSKRGASLGRAFERPDRCSMDRSRAFQAPSRLLPRTMRAAPSRISNAAGQTSSSCNRLFRATRCLRSPRKPRSRKLHSKGTCRIPCARARCPKRG